MGQDQRRRSGPKGTSDEQKLRTIKDAPKVDELLEKIDEVEQASAPAVTYEEFSRVLELLLGCICLVPSEEEFNAMSEIPGLIEDLMRRG